MERADLAHADRLVAGRHPDEQRWLIAARAVQGADGAMVMPLAMALLSGLTGLALLGGRVVGSAIVQGVDWQRIFWLNAPISQ